MKYFVAGGLVLILIGAIFVLVLPDKKTENIDQNIQPGQAHDFIVKDVLGLTAPLSFFYNKKPVVLVFFSPKCSHCQQEVKALKKFHNQYKKDVYIISLVSGKSTSSIKEYGRQNKINFILATDKNASILNSYNVPSVPYHIIINKRGEIVKRQSGFVSFDKLKYLTQRFI